jgi:hypothetical protein
MMIYSKIIDFFRKSVSTNPRTPAALHRRAGCGVPTSQDESGKMPDVPQRKLSLAG